MSQVRVSFLVMGVAALILGTTLIANAGQPGLNSGMPTALNGVSTSGQPVLTGVPLASEELALLQARQAQDLGLAIESGAGCKMVRYWDKHLQKYEEGCDNVKGAMVIGAMTGAIFGAMDGAGVLVGGVEGAAAFWFLDWLMVPAAG